MCSFSFRTVWLHLTLRGAQCSRGVLRAVRAVEFG